MPKPKKGAACKKSYKNGATRRGNCRTEKQKAHDAMYRKPGTEPYSKRYKKYKKPRMYGKGTAQKYWCSESRKNTMLGNGKRTKCAWLTDITGRKRTKYGNMMDLDVNQLTSVISDVPTVPMASQQVQTNISQ